MRIGGHRGAATTGWSLGARAAAGAILPAMTVFAAASSILAAAPPAPVPDLREFRREVRFDDHHPILDRFSAALGRSVPAGDGLQRVEPERLERGFRRAARDTARSLLLRSGAGPGALLSSGDRENRGSSNSSSSGSGDDRVRLRLRVSHLVPGIEMRATLDRGALGVSVNALGKVAAELSSRGGTGTHVRLGFDPAGRRCELSARFSF